MGIFSKKPSNAGSEQKNWYKDRYQFVLVQRNIFLLLAFIALMAALGTGFVVYELMPLKTVEPFVIQVDDRTGYTQVVKPYTATEINANEAVKEYFIVRYIKAREEYNPATASENYRNVVRLLSSPAVYRDFSAKVNPRNPDSPINRYGQHTKRSVEIRSSTYIDAETVLARIKVSEEKSSGEVKDFHYILRLKFAFVELNLPQWERYINPLGFIVTEYNLDEEFLGQ